MITTTLRIDQELYDKIVNQSIENRRSINSEILYMLEKQIKEIELKSKKDETKKDTKKEVVNI